MMELKYRESFPKVGDDMVSIIGAPFSLHQSSCSNHKPETFQWTQIATNNVVFLDMDIARGIDIEKPEYEKRWAWLCESNAIIPEIRAMFDDEVQFQKLIDVYDGIFTPEKELVDRHEKIHFCYTGSNLPWTKKENYKIYEKSKIVSFICSSKLMCEGHRFRHALHERFKKKQEGIVDIEYKGKVWRKADETSIDVYGSILGKPFGHNPGCHLPFNAPDWHDKSQALNDYMFSVVLENAQCDDYFTEKITDAFATGTIPVYWGTDEIYNYFNGDGIIKLTDDFDISQLTPELYEQKLDAIKDNFERVKKLRMVDDEVYDVVQAYK